MLPRQLTPRVGAADAVVQEPPPRRPRLEAPVEDSLRIIKSTVCGACSPAKHTHKLFRFYFFPVACMHCSLWCILFSSCQPTDPNELLGVLQPRLCCSVFVDIDEEGAAAIEASMYSPMMFLLYSPMMYSPMMFLLYSPMTANDHVTRAASVYQFLSQFAWIS